MTPLYQDLLKSLVESSLVKAAAVLDHGGRIHSQLGSAKVFDLGAEPGTKKPNENVYLVELIEHMLLVVFEDHIEFERLRKSVDTLITHYKLSKPTESKQ